MPKKFNSGDIFGVPLPDASLALGQVLAHEQQALNSIGCAFFSTTCKVDDTLPEQLVPTSVLLITPDLINKGVWPVLSRREISISPEARPYEKFRELGWVGAKVTGSGIVQKFLAAYHRLYPWDDWHMPDYLGSLLLPDISRPDGVILCKSS